MSLVRKIFGAPRAAQPTTANRAGYPAWTRPLPEQCLQTLLTNTLGQTF